MKIEYFSPLGEQISDPKLADLKGLVLNRGEDYWNAGSGDAGINCSWEDKTANLQLIFDRNHGFYLVYRGPDKKRFFSFGPGDFDHTVQAIVGGEPVLLPTKFFIPRENAWEAVGEFCTTGQKVPSINWVHSREVNWDYGIPA